MLKQAFPSYPIAPNGTTITPSCPFTPPYTDSYVVGGSASGGGGIGWPMKSYSPQTNYLYICAQNGVQLKELVNSTSDSVSTITVDPRSSAVPGVGGSIVALDMATNKIVWRHDYQGVTDSDCYSGVLSTAGGLVFTASKGNTYQANTPGAATFGGTFYAYDAKTGSQLWKWQNTVVPGTPPNAGQIESPAATYTVNGNQYVAVGAVGRDPSDGGIGNLLTVFSL